MSGGGNATVLRAMVNAMKGATNSPTGSIASLPSNPGADTVTDTGATPASGTRPIGPVQFYQPVYHPSYENYRLPGTPDVAAYGVNMPNPLAYQPHNFQPTMPTAQQAMGSLPQGLPAEVANQGIAALQSQQK